MIKMYRAEVLGKLPVMQHFLFGSILPVPPEFPPNPNSEESNNLAHAGHTHDVRSNGWGDCCGIPVPSAFGAKAAEGQSPEIQTQPQWLSAPGVRPVPFD